MSRPAPSRPDTPTALQVVPPIAELRREHVEALEAYRADKSPETLRRYLRAREAVRQFGAWEPPT